MPRKVGVRHKNHHFIMKARLIFLLPHTPVPAIKGGKLEKKQG